MNQYPSLEGARTGGGGGSCPKIDALAALPTCPSGGCLVTQANRLMRPLFIAELQPGNLVGNRWPDARTLFDYGYRQLFTPDRRAISSLAAGTTRAFGLDSLNDGHAVTAKLVGDSAVVPGNRSTDVTGRRAATRPHWSARAPSRPTGTT
jgi:D-alanyl-D-alanine carboxypeptidase